MLVPLTHHSNLLWYLNGPWLALNQEILHLGTLKAQRLPSCFPGPGFLIAANNFHNCVPPPHRLWTFLCLNTWRFLFLFFLPALSVKPPRKQGRDRSVPYWHHFSHYWIKTNTDVSLIRFQQMSCFIWHCIPGLTWNNLILFPWIMPLHWQIFSPGYFSCISLGLASFTSTLPFLNRSGKHLRIPHHFLSNHIKNFQCAWLIIFSPPQ